jgi:hypothetical protein
MPDRSLKAAARFPDQASGGYASSSGSAAVPDSAGFFEKTSSISRRMVA